MEGSREGERYIEKGNKEFKEGGRERTGEEGGGIVNVH